MKNQVIQEDCLEVMKYIPDKSIEHPQQQESNTRKLDKTFIEYFKKNKGVYSHSDMEKIIANERTKLLKQVKRLVEKMPSPEFMVVSLSNDGETKKGHLYIDKIDLLSELNKLKDEK